MSSWHEKEEFWDDIESILFTAERTKDAVREVGQIINLVGLAPGAAVLDLGCGVGRHALEFARRGHHVTGVDRTARYLEQARAQAGQEKLQVEWVQADMREFRRAGAFDAVVNLLTSFGYFEDPRDDLRVARNIGDSLKPGGTLVVDIMGKEVLARIFRPRDWHREPDGTIVLEERQLTEDFSRIEVTWTLIRGNAAREHRFGHRLYSAAELRELLAAAGFVEGRVFGSLAGAPYDQEAQRLVVVARKPSA